MFKKKRIYLDSAAAAPVDEAAQQAFLSALSLYGNPSALHQEGAAAKRVLQEARSGVARLVGVKSEHVIFTSGATEANALALLGTVKALKKEGKTPELFYHPGAHASTSALMQLLKEEGVLVKELPLREGAIDLETLSEHIATETVLISIEAVSPETGRRFDTRGVRTVLDRKGVKGLLHVDASQLPLTEPILLTRLGADLMTLDAQKVGGVRGVGVLIKSAGVTLLPLYPGGGQEWGMRSGTEPTALAAALYAALREAEKNREAFSKKAHRMRANLIHDIQKNIPDAVVLGGKECAPNILTIALPGRDTDYLVALLDREGFAVSTKSACESDASSGGRMTLAETGDPLLAASTLRVSFDRRIHENDLKRFSTALLEAVSFLDQNPV